ncbi:MAG: tripartite tricarboxylate transporter substrate binding protein [Alphaproteobacteria bacterium]|nr:MAG: tripartite tricarboxylate transporter substrate binding protein [Alphaproteobacteria bacterium]
MHKLAAVVLLTGLAGAASAQAQSYPARTITLTVTAAAGGVTDVVARALGQRLAEAWGQQVVIENKGGAAHVVGAQSVAKATPDGYSLLVAEAGTFTINPTLYGKGKLPYDEEQDFLPITGIVRINQALIGHPSLPATNVRELIALTKKKPGELTYGTAGIGSAPHMNMVLFESMAGVKLQPVHYRGAAPALTDVMAGHVNLMSVSVSLALPPSRAGQVKIFGIGSSKRLPAAAEIPTVAESGLPGYEASTWFGLFAPAGTPREIVEKINVEVATILADPQFREKFLAPQMFEPMASTPEAFADYIGAQRRKWAELIRAQKLSIEK